MITIDIGNGNVLFDINVNGVLQQITINMLHPIWHDIAEGNAEQIEYINAEIYGDLIACCACVSQGQGGIVFIWDTAKQKIVHYSDGKFAVRAAIHNDRVYVLREVSFWGKGAHIEMDFCPLGTTEEDNDVTAIVLDEKTMHTIANDPSDYLIAFDKKENLTIRVTNHV